MKSLRILLLLMMVCGMHLIINAQQDRLDTRIDNIGYWNEMAKRGLTELNPVVPVSPATFTGSQINADYVRTENSPDVPVITGNTTQSENSIFTDPNDPETVLNSNNSFSSPGFGITIYGANDLYSFDGGETWEGEIAGAGGTNQGDPAAVIGLNGRWFIGYIQNNGQSISYSDDQGATWTAVQVAPSPGGLLDKNHLWIDNASSSPYQGNLYDTWTPFAGSYNEQIELAYSTDNGESWTSAGSISNAVSAGSHNQGVNIGTGPNGEVYAVWCVYDSWPSDENAIGMGKSFDGGQTWESTRIIENIRGIRSSETSKDMRVNSFPVCAVDISSGPFNGNIYVVWSNIGVPGINTGSDIDVYMIRSEDEGTTWSDPIRVNQDEPGVGKEHYFPWITCDPITGTLSVIFYDDRDVSSSQCEVYCANSYDAGETWEDFKVSDVSFTPSPIPGLAPNYFGDYLGITARNGNVYPVWTDNRTGTALTYVSPYQTLTAAPPTYLQYVLDDDEGIVNLTWNHNPGGSFDHYNIYRDMALIGTSNFPVYIDTLPDYGIYQYRITAFYNVEGEIGPASATVQWGDAAIQVDPDVMEENIVQGHTSTRFIEMANSGELALNYEVQIIPKEASNAANRSYCAAQGGCTEFISRVTVGEIDNTSGCEGYQDFTAQSTTMLPGGEYFIEIFNSTSQYPEDICGVWIDWDQNTNFNNDEPIIISGSPGSGPYTATITVPEDAANGTTRMRVRINRGTISACGNSQHGEVEDYSINVLSWLTVDPLVGSVPAGETGQIDLNFNAATLDLGSYEVDMLIINNDPENDSVSIPVTLNVIDLAIEATSDDDEICYGEATQLHAVVTGGSGTFTYSWTSTPEGFYSTDPDPEISPEVNTIYHLQVLDGSVSVNDDVAVDVIPLPELDLGPDQQACTGEAVVLDAGDGYDHYLWNTGSEEQSITVYESGEFWVEVSNEFDCSNRDSLLVTVHPLPVVDLGDDYSICEGTTTDLDAGESFAGYLWNTGSTDRTITVSEAGDYSVEVTDENECSNSASISISVDPLPDKTTVSSGPAQVDLNETTTSQFTADAATHATEYEWMVEPQEAGVISGSGLEAEISWTETYNGMASISVQGLNECGAGEQSDAFEVEVYNSLRIDEQAFIQNINVYPNPSDGTFSISFSILKRNPIHFLIVNASGVSVFEYEKNFNEGTHTETLDLSSVTDGVYTLILDIDGQRIEKKVVISK